MPLHRVGDIVVASRDLYSGLDGDECRFMLAQSGDKLRILGHAVGVWDYVVVKRGFPIEGYFFVNESDLCVWIGSFCETENHL